MIKSNKIQNMEHCCKEMEYFLTEGEIHINYSPVLREYAIAYLDLAGGGVQLIHHCPWCGKKLPTSLRDEWYDTLEEMIPDFDGYCDLRIPEEFKTDEWWKKRGL